MTTRRAEPTTPVYEPEHCRSCGCAATLMRVEGHGQLVCCSYCGACHLPDGRLSTHRVHAHDPPRALERDVAGDVTRSPWP